MTHGLFSSLLAYLFVLASGCQPTRVVGDFQVGSAIGTLVLSEEAVLPPDEEALPVLLRLSAEQLAERSRMPLEVDSIEPDGDILLWIAVPTDSEPGVVGHVVVRDQVPNVVSTPFGEPYFAVHHMNMVPFEDASSGGSVLADQGTEETLGRVGQAREVVRDSVMLLSTDAFSEQAVPLTVSMWMRPARTISGFQSVFGYGSPERTIQEHGAGIWYRMSDDSVYVRDVAVVGEWLRVAVAVEADRARRYVNGVLASEGDGSFSTRPSLAAFGRLEDVDQHDEGAIDEFRIRARADSTERIRAEYQAMTEPWLSFEARP